MHYIKVSFLSIALLLTFVGRVIGLPSSSYSSTILSDPTIQLSDGTSKISTGGLLTTGNDSSVDGRPSRTLRANVLHAIEYFHKTYPGADLYRVRVELKEGQTPADPHPVLPVPPAISKRMSPVPTISGTGTRLPASKITGIVGARSHL